MSRMQVRLKSKSPLSMAHGKFHYDLTLFPGQATALVGPNGSGKSTFLHHLKTHFRVDYPELRVGFLDQMPLAPLGGVSGRDLLEMLMEEFPGRCRFNLEAAGTYPMLEDFQWGEKIGRSIVALSGGENQVLKILAHFFMKTEVHFLDEPSNHLDDRKKDLLVRCLQECLRSEGASPRFMLVIDHELSFLRKVCSQVVPVLRIGESEWAATTVLPMDEVTGDMWERWMAN